MISEIYFFDEVGVLVMIMRMHLKLSVPVDLELLAEAENAFFSSFASANVGVLLDVEYDCVTSMIV